ncbi:MAG: cation:proton antiporter, partial [Alphaproteobacteria bacterium]
MHAGALELQDLMTFLFAAGIVVPLARRLRISPALGFLVIGVLIGPHGLARFVGDAPWLAYATIENIEGVHALAELGVVFLLFMIGLELSLERLWQMRRAVFGMGGAQVLTSGVVIAGLAAAFGNDLRTAIVLGCGFALSSTAIVMQILTEGRRIASPTGRASFAVLLFQDLAVLPILFLVAAFGGGGETSPFVAFASAMGQALAAVAIILVAGRLVIRPLFR